MTFGANDVEYGVVLFQSVSHALRGERVAMRAGLTVKLIPVPRQFSSNCGTALRFHWPEEATMRQTLEEARVTIEAIHRLA